MATLRTKHTTPELQASNAKSEATDQPNEIAEALADLNAMLAAEGLMRRLLRSPRDKWAPEYWRLGWDVRQAHILRRVGHVLRDGKCTCGRDDCPSPGKHPIADWRYSKPRSRAEMEREWRTDAWPNIAVLLGRRSQLVVADIDNKPEKYELTVRERVHVLVEHGWRLDTCIERTGSGGLHVYAAIPWGVVVPSLSRYIEPGIELLAEGRLVIVAPSMHASGRHYTWLKGRDPFTMPPAPLWSELVELLTDRNTPARSRSRSSAGGEVRWGEPQPQRDDPNALAYPLAQTKRIATALYRKALRKVHAGEGRNNTAFWLSRQLDSLGMTRREVVEWAVAFGREVEHG